MAQTHLGTFPREPPSASVLNLRCSARGRCEHGTHVCISTFTLMTMFLVRQSTNNVQSDRLPPNVLPCLRGLNVDLSSPKPLQASAVGLLWETAATFDLRLFEVISRAIRPLTGSFQFHVSGNFNGSSRRLPRRKNRGMPPVLRSPVRLDIK